MDTLVYGALMSLDGYTVDAGGNFDWAAPDAEVHAFVNDLERDAGTYLYGRRMYEVMSAWETMPSDPDEPAMDDFARLWRAADKIVFSSTLASVSTARTRIEPTFDVDLVRALPGRVSIGGPTLASAALRLGMVDEFYTLVFAVSVGGGIPFMPTGVRVDVRLVESRSFASSGVVYSRYVRR